MKLYITRKSYSYSPNPSWYKGILKEYKELIKDEMENGFDVIWKGSILDWEDEILMRDSLDYSLRIVSVRGRELIVRVTCELNISTLNDEGYYSFIYSKEFKHIYYRVPLPKYCGYISSNHFLYSEKTRFKNYIRRD